MNGKLLVVIKTNHGPTGGEKPYSLCTTTIGSNCTVEVYCGTMADVRLVAAGFVAVGYSLKYDV